MNNFFKPKGPFTAKELAEKLGCSIVGNGDVMLKTIAPVQDAYPGALAFLDNPKYVKYLEETKATAVIIKPELVEKLPKGLTAIVTPMPYPTYAKASAIFFEAPAVVAGISKSATVEKSATVSDSAEIRENAVISAGAEIADNVYIGSGVFIGENVKIGKGTRIAANSSIIYAEIGENTIIHSGVAIGQDGFGFAFDGKEIIKVPQIGFVKIGNFVEIGANSTIDRGALAPTEIGDMTKIDNLVQIGHNVKIGMMCQIVAQTGVAGSSVLGNGVVLGGQSGVSGHVEVADRVMLAARGVITKSIDKVGEVLGGFPAIPLSQWRKNQAKLNQILKK